MGVGLLRRAEPIHRAACSLLLLASFLAFVPLASAADYRKIDPSAAADTGDTIQVTEFFWYGCPHCYRFEPRMEQWLENKPDDVSFRYIPAVLSQRWALHGRAFFAAKALGVLDQFHMPMFRAMHEQGKRFPTRESIGRFVESLGLDGKAFVDAMDSLGVETRMRRARDLQQAYGVSGTPSVVIDGRYLTSGSMAGNFDRMIEVISERVAAARRDRD